MADADADAKRESIVRRLVKEAQKAPNAEVDARLVRGLGEGALLSEKGSEAISERSLPGSTPWGPGVKAKSALEGVLQRGVDAAERHGLGTAASVAASVPMAAADMLIPTTVGELQMAAGGPKVPKKGAKIIDLSERRQKLEKLVKALKGESIDELITDTKAVENTVDADAVFLRMAKDRGVSVDDLKAGIRSGEVSVPDNLKPLADEKPLMGPDTSGWDLEDWDSHGRSLVHRVRTLEKEVDRYKNIAPEVAANSRAELDKALAELRQSEIDFAKWNDKRLGKTTETKPQAPKTFADPGKKAFEEAIAKKRADDAAVAAKKPEGKLTPEQQAMKRREENARILNSLRRQEPVANEKTTADVPQGIDERFPSEKARLRAEGFYSFKQGIELGDVSALSDREIAEEARRAYNAVFGSERDPGERTYQTAKHTYNALIDEMKRRGASDDDLATRGFKRW